MAHSGSPRDSAADGGKKPALSTLRSHIDKLDRQLVGLMNERAEIARQIGHVKQSTGQQTYDPSREETVLERVASANDGPLSNESVKAVFRELISGSRAIAAR